MAGLSFMAQHPTVPAVWIGDFNMTMNPFLDRPVQTTDITSETRQTRLSRLMIPELNIPLDIIYCVQHVKKQKKHSKGISGNTALFPLPYHVLYSE